MTDQPDKIPQFLAVRPTPEELKWMRRGLDQPGGKIPVFDENDNPVDPKIVRRCLEQQWVEPWVGNQKNPNNLYLACRLSTLGRRLAGQEPKLVEDAAAATARAEVQEQPAGGDLDREKTNQMLLETLEVMAHRSRRDISISPKVGRWLSYGSVAVLLLAVPLVIWQGIRVLDTDEQQAALPAQPPVAAVEAPAAPSQPAPSQEESEALAADESPAAPAPEPAPEAAPEPIAEPIAQAIAPEAELEATAQSSAAEETTLQEAAAEAAVEAETVVEAASEPLPEPAIPEETEAAVEAAPSPPLEAALPEPPAVEEASVEASQPTEQAEPDPQPELPIATAIELETAEATQPAAPAPVAQAPSANEATESSAGITAAAPPEEVPAAPSALESLPRTAWEPRIKVTEPPAVETEVLTAPETTAPETTAPKTAATETAATTEPAPGASEAETAPAAPAEKQEAATQTVELAVLPAIKPEVPAAFSQPAEPETSPETGPQTPAAAPSTSGGYGVQVAASQDRADAERLLALISQQQGDVLGGQTLSIVRADVEGKGVYFRVRTLAFGERGEAARLCESLKQAGQDCFVYRAP